jgi:hypothetical protein
VLWTALLHWLPLSGYVRTDADVYLIDTFLDSGVGVNPLRVFPHIRPEATNAALGWFMLLLIWAGILTATRPWKLMQGLRSRKHPASPDVLPIHDEG